MEAITVQRLRDAGVPAVERRTALDLLGAPMHRGGALTILGETDAPLPWADVQERAARVARRLLELGAQPRRPVVLVGPTSLPLALAVHAVWRLGAPVMVVPVPRRDGDPGRLASRLKPAVELARAPLVLAADELARHIPGAVALSRTTRPPSTAEEPAPPSTEDPAVYQLTSGTTALPRIVSLSHGNLVAYAQRLPELLRFEAADVQVSWLPLAFDMGLCNAFFLPAALGFSLVLSPTEAFIRRPADWMRWVQEHRATHILAPNFAFGIAARTLALRAPDLSSLRLVSSGGETIEEATLRAFERRATTAGMPAEATSPCYGLAEATSAISAQPRGQLRRTDTIDPEALHLGRRAVPAASGLDVASCGVPLPGVELRIVDPDTREPLPHRHVGEIEARGDTITHAGYVGLPDDEQPFSADGFLRTGDLGYRDEDGHLHLTGRAKDLVIVGGRNLTADEIEWAAAKAHGVRPGNVIAFAERDDRGTDAIVVVAETATGSTGARHVQEAIREAVTTELGVAPARVVLLGRDELPKTASGKLQRGLARERYG